MSKLAPGNYYIYNLVLSPSGDKLAITSNGQGAIVTVKPWEYNDGPQQQWTIGDSGDGTTQTICPRGIPALQVAWRADGLSVLPAGNHVWNIRKTDNGYTIKDSDETVNWGLAEASKDLKVTLGGDTGNTKQRWIFERYPLE